MSPRCLVDQSAYEPRDRFLNLRRLLAERLVPMQVCAVFRDLDVVEAALVLGDAAAIDQRLERGDILLQKRERLLAGVNEQLFGSLQCGGKVFAIAPRGDANVHVLQG